MFFFAAFWYNCPKVTRQVGRLGRAISTGRGDGLGYPKMARIRRFRTEDAEEVSNLIRRTLIEVNSVDYPRAVITNQVHAFTVEKIRELAAHREVYVIAQDGELLGTASLEEDAIYTVFVLPTHQGRGIGTRLMKHLEKRARTQGHTAITLPSSTTACAFYEKLGYQAVREVYSDETGLNIIMEKEL
jgi:GNAT superfamily N-acetyltransferase